MRHLYSFFSLQFLKFGIVGVLNTAIDFISFSIFHFKFGLGLITANVLSFVIAVLNSYFLNKYWTFRADHNNPVSAGQMTLFFLGAIGGLGINTVILVVGSKFLPVLWAKALGIFVVPLWSFLFSRYVAFGIKN